MNQKQILEAIAERGLIKFTGYEYVFTVKGRQKYNIAPNEDRKRQALTEFITEYLKHTDHARAYAHDPRHEYRDLSWENRIRYEAYIQAAEVELAKLDFENIPFVIPD